MRHLFSRRGSILVYTLLLLSIMLVAALSLATTAIIGKRGALDTDKSMQAFQTADSGAEIILAKIKNAPDSSKNISTLGGCSDGKVKGSLRGDYTISLFGTNPDGSEKALNCDNTIADVTKIKSSGSFGETTRAIETAVAATGDLVACFSGFPYSGSGSFSISSITGNTCSGGSDDDCRPILGFCCDASGNCKALGSGGSLSPIAPAKWFDVPDTF